MTETPQITDSHCHLDFPQLAEDLDDVVARAKAAGVTRMVTICTRLRQEPQVRAIAERFEPVYFAAGTHPMSAAEEPLVTVADLTALARHPKFVGIGETGLDYHYTPTANRCSRKACAFISRRRGRPGFRLSSTRGMPTRIWRGSCTRNTGRDHTAA